MKTILIISPDIESKRALELAFELEGFLVAEAAGDGVFADVDAVLFDMIDNSKTSWQEFNEARKKTAKKKGVKFAAILPHSTGERSPKECKCDLLIKRPYEMFELVKKVKEVC